MTPPRSPARRRAAVVGALLAVLGSAAAGAQSRAARAQAELGAALFRETALSNPGSDFAASCDTCHHLGVDPRGGPDHFYTDGTPRSLEPGRGTVVQRTTLRNTPSLLDLEGVRRLGRDGRYGSLEELLRDKLTSLQLGWKASDRARAVANLAHVLVDDQRTDYRQLFREAYRVEVESLSEQEAYDWTVRALADQVRGIRSRGTSRWDAFADINRIPTAPSATETPRQYGGRVHGRIGNQEGRREIKRPLGFSAAAYEGFKTFFRVEGPASVGNCVACHVPPTFSDDRFHDAGASELQYEAVHGRGSFARLRIPGPAAQRPVESFLAIPTKDDPQRADLGYWSWIDLRSAPERAPGEGDADLLRRMAGAFRTPNLRNLPRTAPYLHDGSRASIEDVVRAKIEIAKRAQAGELPAVDPELRRIKLDEQDVHPLAEFLRMLDEVPEQEFRRLLLNFED